MAVEPTPSASVPEAPATTTTEKPESKEPEPIVTVKEATEVAVKEPETQPKTEDDAELKKEEEASTDITTEKTDKDVKVVEDPEKKALAELKQLLSSAISSNYFSKPKPVDIKKTQDAKKPHEEEEEPKKPEKAVEAEEPLKLEVEEEPKAVEVEGEPKKLADALEEEKQQEEEEKAKPEVEEKLEKAAEDEGPIKQEEPREQIDGSVKVQDVQEGEPAEKGETFEAAKVEAEAEEEPLKDITLWGVSLLEGGEKADTILLKFLRARDLKAKEALAMIKDTVLWRKEFKADGLVDEDLGLPELGKAVFMHGVDRVGHPVCYNVYGEFENKELFDKAFGDEEKRKSFLRWRVQLLEKGIKELLDFGDGGVCAMVQVNDLKGSPWLLKKEVRVATNHAVHVLQDNYPEFVANQVFINVPWWYLAYNRMISPFLTQRTKSKFIFAGPSKSAEILFKYVAPEQVPVQFGGLGKENDPDFSYSDAVTDAAIKPSSKETIEIPFTEPAVLVWELRVLGSDVTYGAEFVPDAEDRYTIIIQKSRKLTPADEPVEKNSFKVSEPGKVVITIENTTSKKKKLLYRYKTKSSQETT